jgi:hypothetical protein
MKIKVYEHSYKEEDITPVIKGWRRFFQDKIKVWVNYWNYIGEKEIVLEHVSVISYTKPKEYRKKNGYNYFVDYVDYRLPKMGVIRVDGKEFIVSVKDAKEIEKWVLE